MPEITHLPGTPVSPEAVRRMEEGWRQAQEAEEACERKRREKVVLIVGKHDSCDGDIEYISEFSPVGTVRLGGRNQLEEQATCHCKTCGISFNPYFAKYRNQVTAHRERS